MKHRLLELAITLGISIAALWLALVIFMLIARPKGALIREAMRLLPDTIRLLKRLAGDRTLPRGVRVRLWLLFVYLAMPFDIIPDFIPVIGYADDAIIVVAVLRSVVRVAGPDAVRRHWPGTRDGLAALWRLAGLPGESSAELAVDDGSIEALEHELRAGAVSDDEVLRRVERVLATAIGAERARGVLDEAIETAGGAPVDSEKLGAIAVALIDRGGFPRTVGLALKRTLAR